MERYAAMAQNELNPRYLFGTLPTLLSRDTNTCAADSHSCNNITTDPACCANTDYCYISPTRGDSCCDLASDCDNPCDNGFHSCNSTIAVTVTITTTISSTASLLTTTSSSLSAACCQNPCALSQYLCEDNVYCCDNGYACGSGTNAGSCVSTATDSSSGAVATQMANGTATASGVVSSLPSGVSVTTAPSSGLSTGAKAGIGVGVAIVALAIIGLLAFCCIRHRKNASEKGERGSNGVNADADGYGAVQFDEDGAATRPPRPGWLGRWASARSGRGGQKSYFGPRAMAGPFTEEDEGLGPQGERIAGSPGGANSWERTGSQNRRSRGVPMAALGPGDIMVPVELGAEGIQMREIKSGDGQDRMEGVKEEEEVKETYEMEG